MLLTDGCYIQQFTGGDSSYVRWNSQSCSEVLAERLLMR